MANRNLRIFCAAAALTGASFVQAAYATPGSGFAPSPVVIGHYGALDVKTESEKVGHWGMNLKTKDDTDVDADRVAVAPSAFSGWHNHPSAVFVTVTQGSIIWYDGSDAACPGQTFSAGQSFIEDAFRIHNVKNASNSAPAEFVAIHINPAGTSGPVFRIDQPKPTNCR